MCTEMMPADWFAVAVSVSEKGTGRVSVFVDSDEGLKIADCAAFSRKLGDRIEEEELFDNPYKLEVSSPGLDRPLLLVRQYKKNIGRDLKVRLNDGKEISGTLCFCRRNGHYAQAESREKKQSQKRQLAGRRPSPDLRGNCRKQNHCPVLTKRRRCFSYNTEKYFSALVIR